MSAGRSACALLGWLPGEFWAATPAELAMALEGLASPEDARPLTAGEMAALAGAENG